MKPKKKKTQLDLTPMIDTVFLLLIFFLLNPFKTIEGHLDIFLPKDSGQAFNREVEQEEIKDIRIFALENKRNNLITLRLDNLKIRTYPLDMIQYGLKDSSKFNLSKLNALYDQIHNDYKEKIYPKLLSMKNTGAKLNLVINVDPNVPYIFAVEAMNTCLSADVNDIKFAGQKRRLKNVDEGVIKKIKRD